jgi:hypothetical protein
MAVQGKSAICRQPRRPVNAAVCVTLRCVAEVVRPAAQGSVQLVAYFRISLGNRRSPTSVLRHGRLLDGLAPTLRFPFAVYRCGQRVAKACRVNASTSGEPPRHQAHGRQVVAAQFTSKTHGQLHGRTAIPTVIKHVPGKFVRTPCLPTSNLFNLRSGRTGAGAPSLLLSGRFAFPPISPTAVLVWRARRV